MQPIRLDVRTLLRREDEGDDDESTGRRLVDLVREALGRGPAPSVVVVVRADRFDLVSVGPIVEAGLSVSTFIAGLTRSELPRAGPVLAVGLMGTFTVRPRREAPGAPLAMVFLEWTDCRWWQWRTLLEGDGRTPMDETTTLSSAVEGSAKPSNLGGWWSLGRRRRMSVRLEPLPGTQPDLVH